MLASYHNHSNHSDGKAPIDQLALAADAMGLGELGISDHLALPADGKRPPWSMDPSSLPSYIREIHQANQASRCQMRVGLEMDWFPDVAQRIDETLDGLEVDYILGSVHHVDDLCIDGSPTRWESLSEDQCNQVHRRYWQLIRQMAQSQKFDMAAHLDLPKKFGHRATVDLSGVIDPALDAIAESGMVVELNTAGWHKRCEDAYPSLELLQSCCQRDIPVTISADAHRPEHLLRDFRRAADRLAEAGYDQVARFKERSIWFEPLGQAAPTKDIMRFGQDAF